MQHLSDIVDAAAGVSLASNLFKCDLNSAYMRWYTALSVCMIHMLLFSEPRKSFLQV